MQKPYLPVRDRKLTRFIGDRTWPRMEICKISGLQFPMAPHLHQSNGYIRRKVRVWRAQEYNALVGEETVLSSAGPQTTSFHGGAVQGRKSKYAKFRVYQSPCYRVCTKPMVILKGSYLCGELKNVMPLSVQKAYLALRYRKLFRFMGVQYKAENRNMPNFGPTNPHGTAFAPNQWLY